MKQLKDKNIYLMISGAKKVTLMPKMIKELISNGAKVYTTLTNMGQRLSALKELNIPGNKISLDFSRSGENLPLEDLFLIAPCTFNTLNKVASGIADSYPLSLAAYAIGNKRKIVIVPAMNKVLWEHPSTHQSMKILQNWGCDIIWPEITSENVTMAPIEKIADSIYHNLVRIRYDSKQLPKDKEYKKLAEKNITEFKSIGERLLDKGLLKGNTGCLSKRIKEGILVSTSGAHVGNLSPNEISLIEKVEGNKVFWKGENPPSSESPLLYELYSKFSNVNSIIHSHCPKITYNEKMKKYSTLDYIRYGIPGESKQIAKMLKKNDGFAILRLHGEISIGRSLEEVLDKLSIKEYQSNEK